MDIVVPAALFFKRHNNTQDWYTSVLPPGFLPSCSEPIRKNLCCFLPPREIEKDWNSSIAVPLFSFNARILHLPQGVSPTANPVSGTQSKQYLWPLNALKMKTCIASQALLAASVTASSDLEPLTTHQLRPAHYLKCADPHL